MFDTNDRKLLSTTSPRSAHGPQPAIRDESLLPYAYLLFTPSTLHDVLATDTYVVTKLNYTSAYKLCNHKKYEREGGGVELEGTRVPTKKTTSCEQAGGISGTVLWALIS